MTPEWITAIAVIASVIISAITLHRSIGRKISDRSRWEGAVDADRNSFKEFMQEIRKDIRQINRHIFLIFSGSDPDFIDGESPLRLTEKGEKVSKELNAATWAEKTAKIVEIENKEAYNIQEFCFMYAIDDQHYADEELRSIIGYAYNNGITKEKVQSVFGIELRDKVLEIMNLDVPE